MKYTGNSLFGYPALARPKESYLGYRCKDPLAILFWFLTRYKNATIRILSHPILGGNLPKMNYILNQKMPYLICCFQTITPLDCFIMDCTAPPTLVLV